MRMCCLLAFLLVPLAVTHAEEPDPPEVAAAKQIHAAAQQDDDAFQAALDGLRMDPWLVLDALIGIGHPETAAEIATSAEGEIGKAFVAYVEAAATRDDATARKVLAAMQKAQRAGDWQGVVDASQPIQKAGPGIATIRIFHGRAAALARTGKRAEGAATLMAGGKAAQQIGWHTRAVPLLETAGRVYYSLQKWSESIAAFEQLLVTARAVKDSHMIAALSGNVGILQMRLGRHADAIRSIRSAAEAHKANKNEEAEARALTNLGGLLSMLDRKEQALEVLERAIAIRRKNGDEKGLPSALNGIGMVHANRGDAAAAYAVYDEAIDIARRHKLGDSLAAALNNRGLLAQINGDLDQAESDFEEALPIREASGDRLRQGQLLNNLALVYGLRGDHEAKKEAHEKALELGLAIGDAQVTGAAYSGLAAALRALGDGEAEWALLEKSLEASKRLGRPGSQAETLVNMAGWYRRKGDLEASAETYAAAIEAATQGDAAYPHFQALVGLAKLHMQQKNPKAALEAARTAADVAERFVRGLSDVGGATARDVWSQALAVGVDAAVWVGDTEAAFEFMERGRAGTLAETLGAGDRVREVALPEALRTAEAEAKKNEHQATRALKRAMASGKRKEIRRARSALDAAQDELENVVERIQREAKRAADIVYPEPVTLEEAQALLREGEVLVVYTLSLHQAFATVLTRADARLVRLGKRAPIESACAALLSDEPPYVDPQKADDLRKLLIDPLKLGEEARSVLVAPHAVLGYVPFSLLLGDRPVVSVPSATVLSTLRAAKTGSGEGILGIGDPVYGTAQGAAKHRGGRGARLMPLPATRIEVERIATTQLLGKDATEPGLRKALAANKRWRAVHFACHGLVDAEHPRRSSLALTAAKGTDGYLSCLDLFGLPIPADLVVLSACDTGRGKVYRTEGIVGFANAFMFAGAPTVLCSLWKVDDAATQALMVRFYELWNPKDGKAGLPPAEALRQAQAHVRAKKEWAHPSYWAAWVLWGRP